jgi:hypothetical protein
MRTTQIKKHIKQDILSLAAVERVNLTQEQVLNAVEDISLYLARRAEQDERFMLKGNESQDIYDAAKQWFYC